MRAQRIGSGIGTQVGRIRHRREWTQRQLAERVAELGGSLDRAAIAKIESTGKDGAPLRGVSIDEWLLLAAALNVPPPLLLVPLGAEEEVEITPGIQVHPHLALEWLTGDESLVNTERKVIRRGEWLAGSEPLRLWRQLRSVQDDLSRVVAWVRRAEYADDGEQKREAKNAHAEALEALHAHLLRMQTARERPPGMHPQTVADMEAVGLDVEGLPVFEQEEA
ncbi:MAG: helix-turn-helix transcriptional regulator [Actinomycetota bacterium]|nr:helix-turn-helix transcriptional regulator [Actinomycetota bacterium]